MSNTKDLSLFGSELTVGANDITLGKNVITPEFNINAFAKDITATAVDVFVYDTNKDSDGGAWRHRTQHTSWYNETLNTATRGSRKEFPSVAVIVGDISADTVTIYDGDDPDMPMWMVFEGYDLHPGTYTAIVGSGPTQWTISMLNGVLCVGNSGGGNGELCTVNFISDNGWVIDAAVNQTYSQLSISGRNGSFYSGTWATNPSRKIIDSEVNDVAMTVLPNAPIDDATGLPVPTIAVATDGGVSVIKDDGSVVNKSGGFFTSISPVGSEYYAVKDTGDALMVLSWNDEGTIINYTSGDFNYNGNQATGYVPFLYSNGGAVLGMPDNKFAHRAVGLVIYDIDGVDERKALQARITSDHNTGWMNGDIKLATLSDTDDTDVTGTEILSNTDFTSGTSPWVAVQASISAGSNKLTITPNSGVNGGVYDTITTVVGETYVYEVKVLADASNFARMHAGTGNDINLDTKSNLASKIALGGGIHSITFVATGTTTYIWLEVGGGTQQPTEFDDASVRLAETDRSVNNNGLQVFGTVTKDPVATGAELVSYSVANTDVDYLLQPYNADLDFGTGDFCIMWWNNPSSTSDSSILYRGDDTLSVLAPANGFDIWSYAGALKITLGNGGDNQASDHSSTTTAPINQWKHCCFVRRSGVTYFYSDGVQDYTQANATSITGGDLYVMQGFYQQAGPRMALLRMSATAPTAEQIAKIYEDEKMLFQENAQATLYGTSDAVTALAYDETTKLLHVGTSDGRSVFQGLRRVDNTTNAVGVAISAHNGLVAEE